MGTPRILARNIGFAWISRFVYVATALFLTPFLLQSLGEVEFGLWALVSGLTGYYGLLDMGIRPGLTRFITKYRVLAEWEKLNQTASTGVAALAICGLILWLITCLLTYLVPWVFASTSELTFSLRWAIFLLGSSLSLQFPFFFQSAVFVATQRFDLGNIVAIATRLIQVGGMMWCLSMGYGLIGLATIVAVTDLGSYILRTFIATRLIPELEVSIRHVRKSSFKDFASFSGWATLSRMSTEAIASSSRYVVALLLGAAAVTRFQLASSLVSQIGQVYSPIARTFFPALADLAELDRRKELASLYLGGTRLVTLLVMPAVVIANIFAPEFYKLWIGTAAGDGDLPSAAFLMKVLIIGMLVRIPSSIGYEVFHATFRLKTLSKLMAGEAVLNLGLSLLLGYMYGLLGIAIAGVLAGVVFELVLIPIVLSRQLEIPLHRQFAVTWFRPALVGMALTPLAIWINHSSTPLTWWSLALECAITSVAAVLLILCIGLTGDERDRFIWLPLGRRWQTAGS